MMLQDELNRRELETTQTMSGRHVYLCSVTVMGDRRKALKSARDTTPLKFLNALRKIARMSKALSVHKRRPHREPQPQHDGHSAP